MITITITYDEGLVYYNVEGDQTLVEILGILELTKEAVMENSTEDPNTPNKFEA